MLPGISDIPGVNREDSMVITWGRKWPQVSYDLGSTSLSSSVWRKQSLCILEEARTRKNLKKNYFTSISRATAVVVKKCQMILKQTTCYVQAESLWTSHLASLKSFYCMTLEGGHHQRNEPYDCAFPVCCSLQSVQIQTQMPNMSKVASALVKNECGDFIISDEWQKDTTAQKM